MAHTDGQINAKFFIDMSSDTINDTGGFLMYAKIPQLIAKEPQPHEKVMTPNNKNK